MTISSILVAVLFLSQRQRLCWEIITFGFEKKKRHAKKTVIPLLQECIHGRKHQTVEIIEFYAE